MGGKAREDALLGKAVHQLVRIHGTGGEELVEEGAVALEDKAQLGEPIGQVVRMSCGKACRLCQALGPHGS